MRNAESRWARLSWLILLVFALFFPIPCFWIPIHAGIRRLRRFGGKVYWWGLVVWILSLVAFLGFFDFWYAQRFSRRSSVIAAGVALIAVEVVLTHRVGVLLGFSRLVGRSELEPQRFGGALVRTGPYAYVRHPRYVGAMAALFGLALLGGSWRLLTVAAASVPLYIVMTVFEERELAARFGADYTEYRRRVPRFLPRFWVR